jgi:hypothetical protein
MMTGRFHFAAHLYREAARRGKVDIPPTIANAAPQFVVYASIARPADSLSKFEAQVVDGLSFMNSQPRFDEYRQAWLARPVQLAFPEWQGATLETLGSASDLVEMQIAYLAGDSAMVLEGMQKLERFRDGFTAADLSVDALYPEARLLLALGEPGVALAWIHPFLSTVAFSPPDAFQDPAKAGALLRAMLLQAELLAAAGRPSADWIKAVSLLWTDGDNLANELLAQAQATALESSGRSVSTLPVTTIKVE